MNAPSYASWMTILVMFLGLTTGNSGNVSRFSREISTPPGRHRCHWQPILFSKKKNSQGEDKDASFVARLLLTLKSMAYGVRLLTSLINGSFISTEEQVWFGLLFDDLASCSMVWPLV
jgi:hypothetical protein